MPASKPADRRPEPVADHDPSLQGEGNYTAARRHRKAVKAFVASGRVALAARDAAPQDETQAREMLEAEQAGRAPAKG